MRYHTSARALVAALLASTALLALVLLVSARTGKAMGVVSAISGAAERLSEQTAYTDAKPDFTSAAFPPAPYVNLHLALENDSDAEYAASILDPLHRRGWIAAVYVSADFARRHPATVAGIVQQKHELGVLVTDSSPDLPLEAQTRLIADAAATVRQAAGLAADAPLHLRLADYVQPYTAIKPLLEALPGLGIISLAGAFSVDDSFFCRYCAENKRVMYPLPDETTQRVIMIPIAVSPVGGPSVSSAPSIQGAESTRLVPLDDSLFSGDSGGLFGMVKERYEAFSPPTVSAGGPMPYVHDKFLTLILHPSVTGADPVALAQFEEFLAYLEDRYHGLTSNATIIELTRRVLAGGYIGAMHMLPDTEVGFPGGTVTIKVYYYASLFCPAYYFRIYGKYPSQGPHGWQLLGEYAEKPSEGSWLFVHTITFPEPRTDADDMYTVRVVGRSCFPNSCNWPTYNSYEVVDEWAFHILGIKRIEVTPSNPVTTKQVTLRAILRGKHDKAAQVSWTVTPIGSRQSTGNGASIAPYAADGNPIAFIPPADTHGQRRITANVSWVVQGGLYTASKSVDVNIYFRKLTKEGSKNTYADDDGNGLPNWFEYWGRDGAVPELLRSDIRWDPKSHLYGLYNPLDNMIYLGRRAPFVDGPLTVSAVSGACPGVNLPFTSGSDVTRLTIAHEGMHKTLELNTRVGGPWFGWGDSDGDGLPDAVEPGIGLNPANPDGCRLGILFGEPTYSIIGDNEFLARLAEIGVRAIAASDWAFPGKQSTPSMSPPAYQSPAQASGAAQPDRLAPSLLSEELQQTRFSWMARLTGSYTDAGVDNDADGTFDWLRLRAGVQVTTPATYELVSWLSGASGPDLAWASTLVTLTQGAHTVDLFFDGEVLRGAGMNGPYRVTSIELTTGHTGEPVQRAQNVYMTAAYPATTFDPPDAFFNGRFNDIRLPVGSGPFDTLRVNVGVQVNKTGVYTISAGLATASGLTLASAQNSTQFATTGAYTLALDFDGSSIRRHRSNGPYVLQHLRLDSGADEDLAIRMNAYTTTAYSYASFRAPNAELVGHYSDQGIHTDGNGRFDYLRLGARITVTVPGQYYLVGTLVDSRQNTIARARQSHILAAGMHTVPLDFAGTDISRAGVSGPYTVTGLVVLDARGQLQSFEPAPYRTAAYGPSAFERLNTVTGVVRNAEGIPVTGMRVAVIGPSSDTGTTDGAGRYSIGDLLPGLYILETLPGLDDLYAEWRAYLYLGGGITTTQDIRLLSAGRITGRVTNAGGQPVSTTVTLGTFEGAHFATDTDGRYLIPNLAPGSYAIQITSGGPWWMYSSARHIATGTTAHVQVRPGQTTELDFRAPPPTATADLVMRVEKWPERAYGQALVYDVVAENLGNLAATGVRFTATLPAGVSYVGDARSANAAVVMTQPHVVWTSPSLPPGGNLTVSLQARMVVTPAFGAVLTTTFLATSTGGDLNAADNAAWVTTTVPAPYVDVAALLFQAREYMQAGADMDVTLAVMNTGILPATGVRVTYTLPVSVSFVDSGGFTPPAISGQNLVWSGLSLPVCRSEADFTCFFFANITVRPAVNLVAGTILTGVLRASAPGDAVPGNDLLQARSVVIPGSPDAVMVYDLASGHGSAGSDLMYRVSYDMRTSVADRLTISTVLPTQLSYIGHTGGTTPTVSGSAVVWTVDPAVVPRLGNLGMFVHVKENTAPGTPITLTFHARARIEMTTKTLPTQTIAIVSSPAANGPDAFGYTFKNSTNVGGPTYNWQDISATGTRVWPSGSHDDVAAGPFAIGFPFPFYGAAYSQFYLSSNGYLTLGNGSAIVPCSAPLPSDCVPNNSILPFGADGYVDATSTRVYYQTLGSPTRLVVQYTALRLGGPLGDRATFQIILYPDGKITMQYNRVDILARAWKVGLQSATGDSGLDHGPTVFAGLAIAYTPPSVPPTATPTRTATVTAGATATPTRTTMPTRTITPGGPTPTRTPTWSIRARTFLPVIVKNW